MDQLDKILGLDREHPAIKIQSTQDALKTRILVLNTRSWEGRLEWEDIKNWLSNFNGTTGYEAEVERLHALFLLSQFMYFGSREVRVLLRALYREMIVVPFVQRVRCENAHTRDLSSVEIGLKSALARTRILGIGNPSESGTHLLYFFRQENSLSKNRFMASTDIVVARKKSDGSFYRTIRDPAITDYFFIDDVCGSGDTVKEFSESVLEEIVRLAENPDDISFCKRRPKSSPRKSRRVRFSAV